MWHTVFHNQSFLFDNPTFKGMRKSLSEEFSKLSLLDLHGNTKKKEKTPNGQLDQNVFEIQQGVSIILGSFGSQKPQKEVLAGDLWGETSIKLSALSSGSSRDYTTTQLDVKAPLFLFKYRDTKVEDEYQSFPSIVDGGRNGDPAGIVTTHDEFAISWTKEACEKVDTLLSTKNEDEARDHYRLCTQDQWNYEAAKRYLSSHDYTSDLVEIEYRPFDKRHTIFNNHVAVHRRERVMRHMVGGSNSGIVLGKAGSVISEDNWQICLFHKISWTLIFSEEGGCTFPLKLMPDGNLLTEITSNFSSAFISALQQLISISFLSLIEREADSSNWMLPQRSQSRRTYLSWCCTSVVTWPTLSAVVMCSIIFMPCCTARPIEPAMLTF